MRTKAAAVAIAGLLALPMLCAGSPQDGPPRVRLKASAQLTAGGNTSSLDATRWYEGYLVASDADSISLGISPAGDASGMRIPRWAIAAVEKYSGRARGTSTLIGLGAGAGLGAIWAAAAHGRCESSGQALCDVGVTALPLLTASVGAVTGALVGRARWVPVTIESLEPVVPKDRSRYDR